MEQTYSFTPRRELGRTGFLTTALGIGDVADRTIPLETCVATVRRAMDAGLNLIDTAPSYEDGYSEQIVGQALKGRREGMFVIDKIDHLDRSVTSQVEESLGRLDLEAVDLFAFHSISSMEQWNRISSPGGQMEELASCVRQGKARFRGISSHHPEVLRQAILSGLCDVVMFAVGPHCLPRYTQEILPLAKSQNVGTVCFKSFGAGKLLGDTTGYNQPLQERPRGKFSSGGETHHTKHQLPHLSVEDCLHYTLTLDPDVALLGMSYPNEQDAAFTAAASFRPLSPEQLEDIRSRAAQAVQGKGRIWWDPEDEG